MRRDDDDLRFRVSRRRLLAGAAGTAGTLTLAGRLGAARGAEHSHAKLRFLEAREAAVLGAMCDRVFPPDRDSPGAVDIGVVSFLDGQLAGAWGAGGGFYAKGPFHEAETAGLGYQLRLTPRELYRTVLAKVDGYCRDREGKGLADLAAERQDAVMRKLEAGKVDLGLPEGYTSADFFTTFLMHVQQGLFSDPMYGGNRDAMGWSWVGYPGDPMAYGDAYWTIFDHRDDPYVVKPRGMGEGR